MRHHRARPAAIGLPVLATLFVFAAASPGLGDEKLRDLLEDKNAKGTDLWIYNDIDAARKEARERNRPVFVTFRCVPCRACAGFDAEVAKGSERIARLAREKFIPVRQVEMKGVDLSLFQFDHDLNWAAVFINADGTVYARYGTQSAEGPDAYNSIEGLERTMERVLKLHEAYPGNADELKAKRGPKKPYRTALEMPGLERKERYKEQTKRDNCIHCHNIHDAEQNHAQRTGTFSQDMLWRYPLPESIGLKIDAAHGLRVKEVLADSPAARAGLRAGEDITHVEGQAITSIADVQWALHGLPNTDTSVKVRGSSSGEHRLGLKADWKRGDISWRGSIWSLSPRLRVWAPELEPGERRKHGIADDRLALLVKWINAKSPGGRSARQSGLKEGDMIVALDGKSAKMTPNQFNVHIKLNYKVGEKLPLTVLRDGKRRELELELVE